MTSTVDPLDSTPAPHPAIESAVVLDRVVVFDERDGGLHELNESAALVWREIDGHTSVRALAARIQERFDEPVLDGVVAAVHEFDRLGLLSAATPPGEQPVPGGDVRA